jgi:hypothetical protein
MTNSNFFHRRAIHASILLSLAAITLATSSCADFPRHTSNQNVDISKDGFIGNDMLQLSIMVAPDANAKGLVAKRESAQKKAEHNFEELLVKTIAAFRKTATPSCKTAEDKALIFQSKDFMQYTTKIAEYFKEDESIVVIVHISRKNLKDALECQQIKESETPNKTLKR